VARFYSYRQLVGLQPAPVPFIRALAAEISQLPAFIAGRAVLAGSAAWGSSSWHSDVDIVAYMSHESQSLESDIAAAVDAFEKAQGGIYLSPRVDVVWVGSEREELVERDNLVSNSAPIKEPLTIAEIFDRVCIRLLDHLLALAEVKGDPWRKFITRHLGDAASSSSLRHDVVREYAQAAAEQWRMQKFHLGTADDVSVLTADELDALSNAEGFANHFTRQLLGDNGVYPAPDRRRDVRGAVSLLPATLRDDLVCVTRPLFALGEGYEELAEHCQRGVTIAEGDFYQRLRWLARAVDFDAIEEFVWRYVGQGRQQGDPR
jgi:hypothetical protein